MISRDSNTDPPPAAATGRLFPAIPHAPAINLLRSPASKYQFAGKDFHSEGKMPALSRPAAMPGAIEPIRAEAIDTGLHARTIGLAGNLGGPSWRIVHLARGTAEITDGPSGPGAILLAGPVLVLQPWTPEHRLRIRPGVTGAHVLIGPAALSEALGRRPDPADLRRLAEVRSVLPLADQPEAAARIARVTADLLAEVAAAQPGWHGVAEALIRVLLIHLWRGRAADSTAAVLAPPGSSVFARFRGLVEAHVRDRWTVAQYADALGVTPDRLTDICRRTRGLTPHAIVTACTLAEARRLLAETDAPLDRIAGRLGFPSAAQFNRYFQRAEGVPPGRWRRNRAGAGAPARPPADAPGALFDWP
jgi:AraC family transcriptional activator of pobA